MTEKYSAVTSECAFGLPIFLVVIVTVTLIASATGTAAGQNPGSGDTGSAVAAMIVRDADGHVTVRATRLAAPLRIDGALDDDVYRTVPPFGGLIQTLPKTGEPATEPTDVWIFFDDTSLYVSCRCWDAAPPDQWVANEMRRDSRQLLQNDNFGVMLDTFNDKRNGLNLYTTPLGARADATITEEGNPNSDWNPVWEVRTGRFKGGWTAEMVIPFKSLRYRSGTDQVWGIQIRRGIRRKNEWSYLTAMPASFGGATAFMRISRNADLVGLDLPPASRNMELKPYVISSLTTDRLRTPTVTNDPRVNGGIDFKYGITASLTADVTLNTDFAQVEIDEQQVNLTRFSLLFPEKRDFFLEGGGIFNFAVAGVNAGTVSSALPTLFYSRRIGLNGGRAIPIDFGSRMTGKVGDVGIGLMNIQTGDESVSRTPKTNFTVMRVRKDILRRSSIGAIFTNRSLAVNGRGSNQAVGVDANFAFFQNVSMGGYYAHTSTQGLEGDTASYQGRFHYGADRYGAQAEHLVVGEHFSPEVGLVRRSDFKRTFGSARFSPRPESIEAVRQFTWAANIEYIENGAGRMESRSQTGRFNIEFENSDQASVEGGRHFELLEQPFRIASRVTIPMGGYSFNDVTLRYAMGQQRRTSGVLSVQMGQFYDGTITAASLTAARISVMNQWSLQPSLGVNSVHLPAGNFTSNVYLLRSDYSFSPLMFASGLVQYSSGDHAVSSNFRFRWEYRRGSELFAVYSDEWDTLRTGYGALRNRAFVLKINRLVRF